MPSNSVESKIFSKQPQHCSSGEASHQKLRQTIMLFAVVVLTTALLDLVGWIFHISILTSGIPGYATMKPNTALCLGLVSLSLLLESVGSQSAIVASRRFAGQLFSGLALLVSAVSFIEYVTGLSFGIDGFLISVPADYKGEPIGRMALGTSICITMLAVANLTKKIWPRASVAILLAGSVIALSGLLGFVFDAGPLIAVPWLKSMAVHTALSCLLLQFAVCASQPALEPFHTLQKGWHREDKRRYLLFAVTGMPILVATPVLMGLRAHLYDAPFALAFLLVLLICLQTFVMWVDSRALDTFETRLRESDARSSSILQSIGDAVIVTDAEARVTRMNPIAEHLTGWRLDEAEGQPLSVVFDIVNEATRKTVENPVEKVRRLGIIVGLANHTVLLRRDGTETHIDDSSAPIWDLRGELTGIVLVFRDINARKEAEASIKASDEKLKIALETAQLGSWELQLSDLSIECSKVCRMNYGRDASEPFDYEQLWMTVHQEDREATEAAVKDAITNRGVYRAEYRVIWPDSSLHWIVASGRVLLGENGEPKQMVGVTLDVTDRHLAAEALIKTEKLAAVGRLASSIAHEINNPLESVTNLLYLARNGSNGATNAEYIDAAERELKRVSVIANQTLRFHKQSTLPIAIGTGEIIDSVLSMFQGKILNSRIHVEQRQRSRNRIVCFEGEIRQVVSNLVGNAIDALPVGGRLFVRSHDGSAVSSQEPGVFITVADNGGGMSKQTIEKAFEPFFTTKGIVGTGLGLWISHEIIARHGGAIRVRSRQQGGRNGTVFQMFLPFSGPAGSN